MGTEGQNRLLSPGLKSSLRGIYAESSRLLAVRLAPHNDTLTHGPFRGPEIKKLE